MTKSEAQQLHDSWVSGATKDFRQKFGRDPTPEEAKKISTNVTRFLEQRFRSTEGHLGRSRPVDLLEGTALEERKKAGQPHESFSEKIKKWVRRR